MEHYTFSSGFIEHYREITDWDVFEKYLRTPGRRSIRVNTLKITIPKLIERLSPCWQLEQIPWCSEGFRISGRQVCGCGCVHDVKRLGDIPEHKSGLFYIQEASSMIPAVVLDPKPGENILDMCASPGSKTTQIAGYMKNTGSITASDVRADRIAILKRNLERMGVTNCTVLQMPGQQFKDVKFDRILLDPPCSGTGTLRGDPESIGKWDPKIAERLMYEQRSLIHYAYCVLKRGGIMVYSTCSIEPVENEAVIDYLLKRHKKTGIEEIEMNAQACGLNRSKPILEYGGKSYDERIERTMRIMPQDNDTDGFFISKIRKL
jgi:NOL1/NOP2/sun family putative RNA methylase